MHRPQEESISSLPGCISSLLAALPGCLWEPGCLLRLGVGWLNSAESGWSALLSFNASSFPDQEAKKQVHLSLKMTEGKKTEQKHAHSLSGCPRFADIPWPKQFLGWSTSMRRSSDHKLCTKKEDGREELGH